MQLQNIVKQMEKDLFIEIFVEKNEEEYRLFAIDPRVLNLPVNAVWVEKSNGNDDSWWETTVDILPDLKNVKLKV